MAYKGIFKPKNPSKYKGNPTRIVYRSSWEMMVMSKLDSHPDVLQWSSEEIVIPYLDASTGKRRRYFPDFYVKKRNASDGRIVEQLIEVKPKAQTKPPAVKTKPTKRYINEVMTWGTNKSKWEAAEAYCKAKGWTFVIITEDHLNLAF